MVHFKGDGETGTGILGSHLKGKLKLSHRHYVSLLNTKHSNVNYYSVEYIILR